MWLKLAIVLVTAAAFSFGASFLSSAWRRRRKAASETLRLEAMLPGFDCGLCGRSDCRAYAAAIDLEGADPALCLPGGERLETRLRSSLATRPGDRRALAPRGRPLRRPPRRRRGGIPLRRAPRLPRRRRAVRRAEALQGGMRRLRYLRGGLSPRRDQHSIRPRRRGSVPLHRLRRMRAGLPEGRHFHAPEKPILVCRLFVEEVARIEIGGLRGRLHGMRRMREALGPLGILARRQARAGEPRFDRRPVAGDIGAMPCGGHRAGGSRKKAPSPFARRQALVYTRLRNPEDNR